MVKGVNRTVIEVNQTGNKYFEKVIFFVTAEYGDADAAKLSEEAEKVLLEYSGENRHLSPLRKRHRKKRIRNILLLTAGGVAVAVTALLIIL